MKTCAIVLAAGQGKRMKADVAKQYLLLEGKPVLFYPLHAFEESRIDEIVLVVGRGEEEYCRREIVEKYGFQKVKAVVCGGAMRYHSVAEGIRACSPCDVVLVHDGARPFVTQEIIDRAVEGAIKWKACIVGMPVKDTIKLVSSDRYIESSPNRDLVWLVQTPQAFAYDLIAPAYEKLIDSEAEVIENGVNITDDAMVVAYFTGQKVKIVEGSYQNIKITTPEDLQIAEIFVQENL
ncbi:MAG: 2-C-methyl-D-erythritol 4-phosphate cytidylyltransferase [Lachnospiraceae bacterium]|nr:2-C-methyl-D-erythritol 4-phosphate cytidylyltransferase [Lachnospiraceae bacterium]